MMRLATGAVLIACLATAAAWWWWRPVEPPPTPTVEGRFLPPDPRLTYLGPLGNIHPSVRYVGSEACADCHFDIAKQYHNHPMGRSLAPIAELAALQSYEAKRRNPFEALESVFQVVRKDDQVTHRQVRRDSQGKPIFIRDQKVDYVVGSGSRGYSYITNRDGFLFQTPISWYAQQEIWDLSPGFKQKHVTSRPINGECLYCHANHAHVDELSVNRFEEPIFSGHAIGCERCHGPGEKHVESNLATDIVNPRRLSAERREAVCQQCHLEGMVRVQRRGRGLYDFRPGLAFEDFWSVFVNSQPGDEGRRAVNHVEQMTLSACYERSSADNKLGCISCHDPHRAIRGAERVAFYRDRCLNCHATQSCAAPLPVRQTKHDSCMECHMPRYGASDVAHTAATDHRIVRRPGQKDQPLPPFWPGLPVVPFHRGASELENVELRRDLGIGLVAGMAQGRLEPLLHTMRALTLLEAATQRDPGDLEAWLARGHALTLRGQRPAALTAFEAGLDEEPRYEKLVIAAAATATTLQDDDRALALWRRAVELNPWMPEYRGSLAALLAKAGHWSEARLHAEKCVELDPGNASARMLFVQALAQTDGLDAARRQFAVLEALRPANLEDMRRWLNNLK